MLLMLSCTYKQFQDGFTYSLKQKHHYHFVWPCHLKKQDVCLWKRQKCRTVFTFLNWKDLG